MPPHGAALSLLMSMLPPPDCSQSQYGGKAVEQRQLGTYEKHSCMQDPTFCGTLKAERGSSMSKMMIKLALRAKQGEGHAPDHQRLQRPPMQFGIFPVGFELTALPAYPTPAAMRPSKKTFGASCMSLPSPRKVTMFRTMSRSIRKH